MSLTHWHLKRPKLPMTRLMECQQLQQNSTKRGKAEIKKNIYIKAGNSKEVGLVYQNIDFFACPGKNVITQDKDVSLELI